MLTPYVSETIATIFKIVLLHTTVVASNHTREPYDFSYMLLLFLPPLFFPLNENTTSIYVGWTTGEAPPGNVEGEKKKVRSPFLRSLVTVPNLAMMDSKCMCWTDRPIQIGRNPWKHQRR
jgi:hypothetical protein